MQIKDGLGIHIFNDIDAFTKLRKVVINLGNVSKEIHKPGDYWVILTTKYEGGSVILRYFEGQGYQLNTTISFGVTIIVDVYSIRNPSIIFDEIAIRDCVRSKINWVEFVKELQSFSLLN